MHDASSSYILQVPAKTIQYSFTSFAPPTTNNPPPPPTITGTTTGLISTSYTFGLKAKDPDSDKVKYGIDWNIDGVV